MCHEVKSGRVAFQRELSLEAGRSLNFHQPKDLMSEHPGKVVLEAIEERV